MSEVPLYQVAGFSALQVSGMLLGPAGSTVDLELDSYLLYYSQA